MELQVIGTGSSGNAYALHAGGETLLLDAGLPVKTIIRALPEWQEIVGCLVTHEHGDHAKSAYELAALGISVYSSAGTVEAIPMHSSLTQLNALRTREALRVGSFTVIPFETEHDALEPFGFLVRYNPTGETLLYATDTYYLRHTFPGINYWVVECNYVDEIIDTQTEEGTLSPALRMRLKKSHMSLRRLADALKANDLSTTRAIVLVHLSDERSDEGLMVRVIQKVSGIENVTAACSGMKIPLELTPF